MGITSSLLPQEPCRDPVPGCGVHPPEISDSVLTATAHYVRTLGVPARRSLSDPGVQRGEQLFASAGCIRCHVPTLATGTVPDAPEVSGQSIHPYTDLLLHDMGPGLADSRPDFLASGLNGAPRRSGASGSRPWSMGTRTFCTMGGPATCSRRFSGTGERRPARGIACSRFPRRIETR